MMRSVLLGAIITLLATALHAEPSECYASTFKLRDYSAATETWGEATSFMKITKIDNTKIQFELLQYGGNFHTCTLPGFATKQPDGSFIFKDEASYWSEPGWELYGAPSDGGACEINFKFTEQNVTINAVNSCKGFCGARAAFGGVIKKAQSCSEYSL
jgi:hypothetical protein